MIWFHLQKSQLIKKKKCCACCGIVDPNNERYWSSFNFRNHLAASYIHPLIKSLFSIACNNKVSHCSNTLPEADDTTGKRPNYIVDVYKQYQYAYPSCFGEIKIEKANYVLKVFDFYRLAVFGRHAIENHNLNGIICFQTIGSLVTFYYMLPRADFFIFLEVTSIKIPMVKRDIVSIITHLDDMLSLVCLHELVENTNELASSYPPILPYVYVQNERKSLPKKRKPYLTLISSSSKHWNSLLSILAFNFQKKIRRNGSLINKAKRDF